MNNKDTESESAPSLAALLSKEWAGLVRSQWVLIREDNIRIEEEGRREEETYLNEQKKRTYIVPE